MDRRTWLRRTAAAGSAAWTASWLSGCDTAPSWYGAFTGQDVQRAHLLRQGLQAPDSLPVQHCETLICGGGITGLAAARVLEQAGRPDWVLLEMQDHLGGNSQGGTLQGLPCPLGAHYLPLPGPAAPEVQALLEELQLCNWQAGRWVYDERHLCHSPQERLFWQGAWQEGVLPVEGISARTRAQYQQFGLVVQDANALSPFQMPTLRQLAGARGPSAAHQQWDHQTMAQWLDAHQLDDPQLRWYLDYCCRDDFGASTARVSAWAGLHYFASRGGWSTPGTPLPDENDNHAVLTWPQGNGWLTQQMQQRLQPGAQRLRTAHTVFRIEEHATHVQVTAYDHHAQQWRCWRARHAVVALPLFVAAHVVCPLPEVLREAARHVQHAPWLVANLHLRAPLKDRPGAAPAWDNVRFDDPVVGGLGYVDARHQSLDPRPGPTVLTYYQALGDEGALQRQRLLQGSWQAWAAPIVESLQQPHPDLPELLTEIALTRYGHAMAIPLRGSHTTLQQLTLQANQTPDRSVRWQGEQVRVLPVAGTSRLRFAHADWAAYSVFEEAMTRGHHAALSLLA